jgi:hypothetical protein
MNPHATVESNFKHRFGVSVWCGILYNQSIDPFIFEGRLTGAICYFCKTGYSLYYTMLVWQHDCARTSNTAELVHILAML